MALASIEIRKYLAAPCRVTARDVLEMLREIESDPHRNHRLDGPLLLDVADTESGLICLSSPIYWNEGCLSVEWEDVHNEEWTLEERVKLAAGREKSERLMLEQTADYDRINRGQR